MGSGRELSNGIIVLAHNVKHCSRVVPLLIESGTTAAAVATPTTTTTTTGEDMCKCSSLKH